MQLRRIVLTVIAIAVTGTSTWADTDAARVETGSIVYQDYCSSCHGDGLKNTSGGVTFDLRRLKPEDHERFVNSVLNGKRQMPPWRGALADEQIEAIWAYIRATLDK
jgi:mono/diheme cytochrome c family protein